MGPNPKQTLINQQLFYSHVDSVIHFLPCCYFCPLNRCFPACHRSVVASKSDKHYLRCIRRGFQGLCLVSACWLRRLLLLYGLHTLIGLWDPGATKSVLTFYSQKDISASMHGVYTPPCTSQYSIIKGSLQEHKCCWWATTVTCLSPVTPLTLTRSWLWR